MKLLVSPPSVRERHQYGQGIVPDGGVPAVEGIGIRKPLIYVSPVVGLVGRPPRSPATSPTPKARGLRGLRLAPGTNEGE